MLQPTVKIGLKKVAFITFIGSLVGCALVAISVFLFGSLKDSLTGKILITTIVIMIFSLTGLCNAAMIEGKKNPILGWVGFAASAVAAFFTLALIWELIDGSDDLNKFTVSCVVVAVAIAHATLLQLIQVSQSGLLWMRFGTQLCIGSVAFILIVLIHDSEVFRDDSVIRTLGVLAVLSVLGTALLPLLKRLGRKS